MSKHLIHAHSSTVTEGAPNLPAANRIEYGEIAINYAKGHETISIKNSNNEIVTFPNAIEVQDNLDKTEKVIASALNEINDRLDDHDDSIDGLSTVAISGSYNDLTNKPTIPSVTNSVTQNSTDAVTSGAVYDVIVDNEISIAASLADLENRKIDSSDLSTVATSGSYNDLTNKPTIPAAQVQSDWNQSTSSEVDYIKNKPHSLPLPYGTVTSSSSTVITATVEGVTELADGVCCVIKNGGTASASGWTLNVNGLGAKNVYVTTAAETRSTTQFAANYTMMFIYVSSLNGWRICQLFNTNSTYTNAGLGQGYGTCTTAAATAAKAVTLSSYALTANGIVAVRFTNAVPANATMNINSKGAKAIYYKNAAITAGVINAGDVGVFIYSTYYHLIAIDKNCENSISGQTINIRGNTLTVPTTTDTITESSTAAITSGAVYDAFGSYERVISAALNDLNERVADIETMITTLSSTVSNLNSSITSLTSRVTAIEEEL